MPVDRDYNCKQISRLEKLLAEKRQTYRVDLHLHTNKSADGLQTVEQALAKAKELQFDIVSITDHDSIDAYHEIVSYDFTNTSYSPVVIPGIEFTVSCPLYNGRCHVLKYFFDADDPRFQLNLLQNRKAYETRVKIWFERIKKNKFLQYFFKAYNISCSEEGFWKFLREEHLDTVPEYPSLAKYIYTQLNEKGVSIWDVYNSAVADNKADPCKARRLKKAYSLDRFYERYHQKDILGNYRKLRPIIAAVGVDDADYPGFPSSGSLSVNEYGQVPIQKLNNCGFNILAHPDVDNLNCVERLRDTVVGVELNCHSSDIANAAIRQKAMQLDLLMTYGSDKHSNTNEYYEEISFYEMPRSELQKFLWQAKHAMN